LHPDFKKKKDERNRVCVLFVQEERGEMVAKFEKESEDSGVLLGEMRALIIICCPLNCLLWRLLWFFPRSLQVINGD